MGGKAILFDESHGDYFHIANTEEEGLSLLVDILKQYGFEISTAPSLGAISNAGVFVVNVPQKPFTEAEVAMLKQFVDNGGGLLLVAELGNILKHKDNIGPLASAFGIGFNPDHVTEESDDPTAYTPIVVDNDHPVMSGVSEVLYLAGCSLRADGDNAFILAYGDHHFADADMDMERDEGEEGYPPIIVGAESGQGRVIALGDGSMITNEHLLKADNKFLMVNVMRWLLKQN